MEKKARAPTHLKPVYSIIIHAYVLLYALAKFELRCPVECMQHAAAAHQMAETLSG